MAYDTQRQPWRPQRQPGSSSGSLAAAALAVTEAWRRQLSGYGSAAAVAAAAQQRSGSLGGDGGSLAGAAAAWQQHGVRGG
jgi:hypothetical protein